MTRRLNTLIAGAMLGALALGGAVQAQPAPPPPNQPMGADAPRPHRDPTERLRAVLQLRPNQEPALQNYVAALKAGYGDRREAFKDRPARPATTPERLAQRDHLMVERLEQGRARDKATLAFYNQLDAGQKKAFDTLGEGRGHGKPHGDHGGRPGGHGHDRKGPPPAPAPAA